MLYDVPSRVYTHFCRSLFAVSVAAWVSCARTPVLRTPVGAEDRLRPTPAETLAAQVEVIRTDYGVPHIYAENFKALGYALGYLQLEDYGRRVPMGMVRAQGELARHLGSSAIESDFQNRPYYLRAREIYFELGLDTRDVYEGFATGVNRYIERRPEEFPPWMRPEFTAYDVAALYVYRPSLRQVNRWVQRIEQAEEAPLLEVVGGAGRRAMVDEEFPGETEEGSSAWALAPSRTTSGAAILMRNPHLDWTAGYWEVHAVVEGRLDFYGDFRIGVPLSIIGGFNRHLGFATTNNSVDDTEVYALEADPAKPDHYLFDDTSMPILRQSVTVTYADGAGLAERARERLYTHLGPVLYQKHGRIYVIRTPEDGEFRAAEQFLRMIQARNLEEWKDAMRLAAHPGSNFTYADAEGNIFYVWNAVIPVRPHPAGDTLAIPARHTEEVWTEVHDFDSLPQLLNPKGGYLRDENDGPWFANMHAPIDPADYPDYFEENEFGLRSQHSVLLIESRRRFSLDDVVELKHSHRMLLADRVKDDLLRAVRKSIRTCEETISREVGAAADLLEAWDNTAGPKSHGSVLFAEWWRIYTRALTGDDEDDTLFAEAWTPEAPMETPRGLADPVLAAELFEDAVASTARRFGTWDVAWGEVHRVRRGLVDEPVGGCEGRMGCFRVLNFSEDSDGKRRVSGGDGWVLAVEFTDPPRAYSILGYGQSSKDTSPHYADQARMFARGQMKPVFYTRESVEPAAIRRYRPGLD